MISSLFYAPLPEMSWPFLWMKDGEVRMRYQSRADIVVCIFDEESSFHKIGDTVIPSIPDIDAWSNRLAAGAKVVLEAVY